MKVAFVLIVVLFSCSVAQSQTPARQSGSSTASSLTVTATVAPSVWLVMEPDGKQNVVVANAPDPKESFSPGVPVKVGKRAAQLNKQPSSEMHEKSPHHQTENSVQFNFPTASKQFDVTQKTVIMNLSEGGKTVARPVIVTTIVVQ